MIVLLQGGLGNQMFQYAFGRSVAHARKEPVWFEKRGDMDNPGSRMAYSLGAFESRVSLILPHGPESTYEEEIFAYDKKVYTLPEGLRFVGYWQTEKYFQPELVRGDFHLRAPISAQTQRVADEINASENSVAIHVRRTDYLLPMNSWMGIMPMSYYAQAMAYIRERCPDVKFFVFSDDSEWCLQNFPDCRIVDHNKAGTSGNGPGQEHEDLLLMSLCRHAIIANSSFGWWGAWLGDFSGKIVVAPIQWFNGTLDGRWTPETSDIVPARWVKI
jgi:hypothetical protein